MQARGSIRSRLPTAHLRSGQPIGSPRRLTIWNLSRTYTITSFKRRSIRSTNDTSPTDREKCCRSMSGRDGKGARPRAHHPAAAPLRSGTRFGAILAVKGCRLGEATVTLTGERAEPMGFLAQPSLGLVRAPSIIGEPSLAELGRSAPMSRTRSMDFHMAHRWVA